MPMHNWKQVKSGTYHHFHYMWLATISNHLNAGLLPPHFFAMAEQRIGGPEPDVITLSTRVEPSLIPGGSAVAPKTRFIERAEAVRYARKTNRIAIHHDLGTVVAVIELVSPGNKDTRPALRSFCRKTATLIRNGVHVLVIDPFPPGRYDPNGIHHAIWENVTATKFALPADTPLTLVSYEAGECPTAYVEPIAVGDLLPEMPLYLEEGVFIQVPLEASYQETWNALPRQIRELVDPQNE